MEEVVHHLVVERQDQKPAVAVVAVMVLQGQQLRLQVEQVPLQPEGLRRLTARQQVDQHAQSLRRLARNIKVVAVAELPR